MGGGPWIYATSLKTLDYCVVIRRLFSFFTTFAIVLHAVLGCCAHHTHAGSSHCGTAQFANNHQAECQHAYAEHGHHEAAAEAVESPADGSSDHAPCEGGPCDEPDCVFLVASRCDHLDTVLSLPVWSPFDTGDLTLSSSTRPVPSPPDRGRVLWPGHSGPSMTQVWLL